MITEENIQSILGNCETRGLGGKTFASVTQDSRKVSQGALFVAQKGVRTDGHAFIGKAISAGASGVVCEKIPDAPLEGISYFIVEDASNALGVIAHAFYGYPTHNIKLLGITGTNGKTTGVTLLHQVFSSLGYAAGMISTVVNKIGERELASTHTTPDPIQLNMLLAEMVGAGCEYCFMEVSSHAIHQKRIAGLKFAGGVFTNISHDHLDYHRTFKEYIEAKKAFFDKLPAGSFALSNVDDKRGRIMLQNFSGKAYTYSLEGKGDFNARIQENALTGLKMELDGKEFHSPMIGYFNGYNLLMSYAIACLLDQNPDEVLQVLSIMSGAPGRFECMRFGASRMMAIVDYAHTPDALKNVLSTLLQVKEGDQLLVSVVGCGGDRDPSKRPIMGQVAAELSDRCVFTSDNPRSEDPEKIIRDMHQDINPIHRRKILDVVDRRNAIKTAIMLAQPDGIVLVAGKGHETYQEIQGRCIHFDDKEVIGELFHEIIMQKN